MFPFAGAVGQQLVKKAILLSIINPRLSPVLIRGLRGTAKSTIANSLGDIVPDIETVSGCEYNCDPVDRDGFCPDCRKRAALGKLESAVLPMPVVHLSDHPSILAKKFKTIESWSADLRLLIRANRGIMVADKINLYDERLVDSLITFGRRGFKSGDATKVSNFILIATMNIEDGEISPELFEKFTIQVDAMDISDIEERIEITKRAVDFRKNPIGFIGKFAPERDRLRKKIIKAKEDLKNVECPAKVKDAIAAMTKKFKLKGMDETIEQVALTNAAYEGKRYISIDDVKEILDITVAHKL
jgi:Mg-chelatase subunit ChlI